MRNIYLYRKFFICVVLWNVYQVLSREKFNKKGAYPLNDGLIEAGPRPHLGSVYVRSEIIFFVYFFLKEFHLSFISGSGSKIDLQIKSWKEAKSIWGRLNP